MYYIVTGAAGFIGSRIVEALNAAGVTDVIAVDNLQQSAKVRNLAGLEIADLDEPQVQRRGMPAPFEPHQVGCREPERPVDQSHAQSPSSRYSMPARQKLSWRFWCRSRRRRSCSSWP